VSALPAAPHVAVIGNVNVDMVMGPQTPWPKPGTEVVLPDYELRVGGSAGNAALALGALGVPVRLLANAGDDILGRWLKDSFAMAATHWRLAEVPTTVSVGVTHPNGERTFLTNKGHLDVLGPEDVLPFLPKHVPAGSVALIAGVFLSPPLLVAMPTILAALKAAGYRVAIDPGWPPESWSDTERTSLMAWLPAIDLLLINEVEATGITGVADMRDAVTLIRAALPEDATLVVKRGSDGAEAWRRDQHVSFAAPKITVADSIGAGDIFNAGFLAADLERRTLSEAVARGVRFASAAIATRPRRYDVGS
jgi:sugar/nucleoside kinase (ribokinase family)